MQSSLVKLKGISRRSLFKCDYDAGVLFRYECVTFTYKTVSSGEIRHAKRQVNPSLSTGRKPKKRTRTEVVLLATWL